MSVCLPARDEARTVGPIVRAIAGLAPLVDEVLVVDDGSSDATAAVATAAGASVVGTADVFPGHAAGAGPAAAVPPSPGKGQAMWKAVAASRGDIVVFCDADLEDFDPRFVTALVTPLLLDETVALVKGAYDRPFHGRPGEGGRVTELVARPLIRLLFPELAFLAQPLAGECAGRRAVLEQVPFVAGWGVELGLVVDISRRCGPEAITQVDLGVRVHRNRALAELAPQAEAVLHTALARAGVAGVPPLAECPPLREVSARS